MPPEREELLQLIQQYINIFAWSYEDMSSLDPQLAMHQLNIDPKVKPVKQPLTRF